MSVSASEQPVAYVAVTTLGAYQYARGVLSGAAQRVLQALLSAELSPVLEPEWLETATGQPVEQGQVLLKQLRAQRLVALRQEADCCPRGNMRATLPQLLAALSEQEKAMLVDDSGLCIAQHGFSPLEEEVLPAFASKITAALQHAEQGILDILGMSHGLPCLFDPENRTMAGFLNLKVADAPFVLLIMGRMRLRTMAFRDLIWVLGKRYGTRP